MSARIQSMVAVVKYRPGVPFKKSRLVESLMPENGSPRQPPIFARADRTSQRDLPALFAVALCLLFTMYLMHWTVGEIMLIKYFSV